VTPRFEGAEREFPQEFVENFNASNPDIEVLRIEPEWTCMMADMVAGTASDLILVGWGTDVAYFSLRGLFLDITDRLKSSEAIRCDPSAAQTTSSGSP
jgi:ABC-type glycerol-3-phosphate transport system substrate-binding protein